MLSQNNLWFSITNTYSSSYFFKNFVSHLDTPPSSLMDLNANPKVTIAEGNGVGVHFLAGSTSG